MKKYAILGFLSATLAIVASAENMRAAKAAHRLTDEQLMDVISKAPSGSSVTVPADFFRDVIAGKYRWRNATNWIARASGDDTMVKALESMDKDMRSAFAKVDLVNSYTNTLSKKFQSLKNEMESRQLAFDAKYSNAINATMVVKKNLREAIDDLLATRLREKDAVARFYEFRDKFLDADARFSAAKHGLIARRAEVQAKYDEATILTKPTYKFFLDVIDAILEDFDTPPTSPEEMENLLDKVIVSE